MKSRHVFILITLLVILDAFAINCSFAIVYFSGFLNQTALSGGSYILIVINLSWLFSALICGTYSFVNVQKPELLYKKLIVTFGLHFLIILTVAVLFLSQLKVVLPSFYIFACAFLFLMTIRVIIQIAERYYLRMNLFKKNIAIIGDHELGTRLESFFLKNSLSVNFTGSFSDLSETVVIDDKPVDNLRSSIRYAIENDLDEVYTTVFPEQSPAFDQIFELAEQHCVRIRFVTSHLNYQRDQEIFNKANYRLSNYYDGIPILVNRVEPLTKLRNRIIKRGFDILFSLTVIVFILSWLFPIIILLILMESKGNPIFKQLRSGRDNEPFYCFKFRSMRINASSNTQQATRNDPRITKIGAFIRKTSIDELPQFFNVLFGDMSVVGPRPHMLKHTEEYRQIVDQYMVRQFLKPGITGQAQVNGFRGETKDHKQMEGRVKHDISYMENWSLLLDLKIIYKTVANAIGGEENAF